MLEAIKGELTVAQLLRVLKGIKNPEETYVATENVQDGINRHNGIVGFEDDYGDEYLILKIFNEAQKEKQILSFSIIDYLEAKDYLSEQEQSILDHAQSITQ